MPLFALSSALSTLPAALLAQAEPNPLVSQLALGLVIVAIVYFVMFRPQQKQQQEQEKFLSGLQKGDDVVTTGGLIGKVFQVAGKVVTLEIAPNVKARVLVSQIAGPLKLDDEAKDSAKVQEDKK